MQNQFNRGKLAFSMNEWYYSNWTPRGKKKKKRRTWSKPHILLNINLKGIVDLNVKCKTIKHLEKKHRRNSLGPKVRWGVHRLGTKSMIHKRKYRQVDLIRIKNFTLWKTLWKGWKATNWGEISADHIISQKTSI